MHSLWANSARSVASSLACLLPAACCLLAAGCNNSGRQMQTDLYQRELRLQEDEIYRLEDYIEEYQGIVRGYRCKVEDLERDLIERRDSLDSSPASPAREPEALPAPAATLPDTPEPIDMGGMPEIEMPEIETPDSLSPPADALPSPNTSRSGGEPQPFEGANASPMQPAAGPIAAQAPQPAPIETVALVEPEPTPPNPYPTATPRKYVSPVTGTDASLSLRIEAGLDPDSFVAWVGTGVGTEPRAFDGKAAVMLTDPTLDSRQRRIARWDFTAQEVAQSSEPGGSLLRFEVSLPAEVPRDQPLRVWVRLVDQDGRKRLQASEVSYTDAGLLPLEIGADSIADARPMRLPPTSAEAFVRTRVVEPLADDTSTARASGDGWRAASRTTPERRFDNAVAPASFDSDW